MGSIKVEQACGPRAVIGLALAFALLMLPGPVAQASDESATSSLSMTPISGTLFRELAKPVDWEVEVEVKAPYPQSNTVTPVKEIRASLPRELSFNPDPRMKVCPDNAIGPDRNLSVTPDAALALCPDSVIGNGTAEHYISHANSPSGPNLTDGVIVIFNGGRTAAGLPRIKIYGYSGGANTGIYMEGVLEDGQLDVSIPVLPFDSATGRFHLEIPGSSEPHENRRGQDPAYARATCPDGQWDGQVGFLLGTRDTAGDPLGPESKISAPPLSVACEGLAGKARVGRVRVKGPGKVKRGGKGTYRVTVTNVGTATATGLKVSASGKGVKGAARAGKLRPGKTKTIKVKVKFRRSGTSRVKFRVGGKGLKPRSTFRKIRVS